MRKALIVGIDDYKVSPLEGCVNDALAMADLLSYHHDDDPNFECETLISATEYITSPLLRKKLQELFLRESEVAIFYFSGHGTYGKGGGHLNTQEMTNYNLGFAMTELMDMANMAVRVQHVLIILDCCYSGQLGNFVHAAEEVVMLRKGVSVLSASQSFEKSVEVGGHGVFTNIVLAGLQGEAADIQGNVTVERLYNYADKLLGPWQQRPVLKSHTSKLVPIRRVKPNISVITLRKLPRFFKTEIYEFIPALYTEKLAGTHVEKRELFDEMMSLYKSGLIEPVGTPHMHEIFDRGLSVSLTLAGKMYWRMAKKGRL